MIQFTCPTCGRHHQVEQLDEATNRSIRDGEQTIEVDVEVFLEFALVVAFEGLGRWRQGCAEWIINEIQLTIPTTVTEFVQPLQRADALVEDAVAALLIDILGRIARHTGNNRRTMLFDRGEKAIPAGVGSGQVGADFDFISQSGQFFDEIIKAVDQLRRAASDVGDVEWIALGERDNILGDRLRHFFFAIRSC